MGDMSITVSKEWDGWVDGFTELSEGPSDEMVDAFRRAADFWYDQSQQIVHVVTGRLKASGQVEVERSSRAVEAVLRYDTPYALDEHGRGGEHAWMDRAWVMSEAAMLASLGEGWSDTVASWR